jgi:2-hydroxychromene-2-carboxylate isomerase
MPISAPSCDRVGGQRAGLDPKRLLRELAGPGPAREVRNALAEFERLQCPGVPTVVVNGQRFFGKDRVDWAADVCRAGG